MSKAEVMGEEFKKTRDFYIEKIRRELGNENIADLLEQRTSAKLANKDYIDGVADQAPECREVIESLHEEVKELQDQGDEAHNWTRYFERPNNNTQKGFQQHVLANDIMGDFTFRKLRDSEEIYVFKNGFYQPKGQQVIEEECAKRLGPEYEEKYYKATQAFIQARIYVKRKNFRPPQRKINLQNGVYDLEKEDLEPHNPDYNFRHKIPVKYNPNAECDKIHNFLHSIVETEEEVKTLQEIAGYCLLPDYPINKAFMLIGKGSNGKSLYLDMLKRMLGEENYVNKSLQDIEDNQYATSKLVGSIACFDDDLPSTKLTHTSTLKKLTGGSDIGAEVKYGDQFDFKNIAKFVFACNELPRTNDESDGFYRRWILVEFPYKFKENPDPDNPKERKAIPKAKLMQEITKDEQLEGFLWWAIESLKDVINNNEFTHAPTTDEARQKWKEYSIPLVQFIEKYIEQGTTWEEAESMAGKSDDNYAQYYYDYIRKDFLKEVIGDYCEARSHSRPSKKSITRELKNSDFYMNEKAKTKREPDKPQVPVYGGLRMRYPENPGGEGLKTYSQTLLRACGHACVKESSKQSVHPFTPSNTRNEIRDLVKESGGISVEDVIEQIEGEEKFIEETIEKMKRDGELFEPESGQIDVI